MPFAMEQLTQGLTILGKMDPVSQANGAAFQPSTDIDMSKVRRLMIILQVGAVGGAGTVNAQINEAKTAGGAYQALVANPLSIAQVTVSNKVVTIELRDDQLD